jgi:hypothetical protein
LLELHRMVLRLGKENIMASQLLKEILITASCLATIGIYYPMWKRLYKRKHSRDFSLIAQWFIFGVQVNNLFLAIAEHAPFLTGWYILQSILTGGSLILVYKYWEWQEPRLR